VVAAPFSIVVTIDNKGFVIVRLLVIDNQISIWGVTLAEGNERLPGTTVFNCFIYLFHLSQLASGTLHTRH
jgi:hypothetical protein